MYTEIDLVVQGRTLATLRHKAGGASPDFLRQSQAFFSHIVPWRAAPRAGCCLRDRRLLAAALEKLMEQGFEPG